MPTPLTVSGPLISDSIDDHRSIYFDIEFLEFKIINLFSDFGEIRNK